VDERRRRLSTDLLYKIEAGRRGHYPDSIRRVCGVLQMKLGGLVPGWRMADKLRFAGDATLGIGYRRLREQRNVPLETVAMLSGYSISALSRFERGLTLPRGAFKLEGRPEDKLRVFAKPELARALGICCAAELTELARAEGFDEQDGKKPPRRFTGEFPKVRCRRDTCRL